MTASGPWLKPPVQARRQPADRFDRCHDGTRQRASRCSQCRRQGSDCERARRAHPASALCSSTVDWFMSWKVCRKSFVGFGTYRIVVSDLLRCRPIWFGGEDRSEASMSQFYAWLGERKSSRIRLAVMDMWKPFRLATQAQAPQAAILFDKFHVMRHLGEALDAVRKSLRRAAGPSTRALTWRIDPGQRHDGRRRAPPPSTLARAAQAAPNASAMAMRGRQLSAKPYFGDPAARLRLEKAA
jgi:hypothetical protein